MIFAFSGIKRKKRNIQEQDTYDIDKLELTFNPVRQSEYLQGIEAQRHEARQMYENMDLEKGYKGIFEMLWYSQLPCFDVKEVTSTRSDEHGMTQPYMYE